MRITFEKVTWKNLLSYGNDVQTYNFKSGIDLINAINGAGKSTVIESVFYALFGVPFRKIKKGSLVNDINKKKLLVELFFSIDEKKYKVKRGQKPNVFVIYEEVELEDGKKEFSEILEKATVKEYQDNFEDDILKIDETVFRQLISISSNMASSKPFMELTQREKEKLFQVVTDTSIFNHLSDKIKLKIQDAKIGQKEAEYKRDIIDNAIQSEEIMIEQAKKQNEDFENHHNDNIKQTEESIRTSKENIQKYKDGIEKLRELKDDYDSLNIDLIGEKQELTSIEMEMRMFNEGELDKIEEKYKKLLQDEDDRYFDLDYKKEEEHLEILQDEKIKAGSKIREIGIIIKQIEAAKKGSIQCKSCDTVNYITDIDEEEVQKHDEFITECNDLESKVKELNKEFEAEKAKLQEIKEQEKENHHQNKKDINSKKDKEIKLLRENQDEYKSEEREILKKEINKIQSTMDAYKEKLLKSKHIKATLQEHEDNLKFYENKLVELSSVKMIKIDEEPLKEKKEQQKQHKKEVQTITKSIQDLNYLMNMLSDKGENNLKGQIIARTIPFLNKGINYFLEKFSLNEFNFIVDEQFKERIISRENNTEYNSLSNGQKMRISFSIMFSFLKLIEEKNGVSTNMLFLDEILDGSLDAAGREELLHILKDEFSEQKNIIIISHNQEIKEKVELFDRMIKVQKDKFSSLEIE